MSEQQQLVAWRALGVAAVALALVTVYLFVRAQQTATHAGSSFRIAYTRDLGGTFQIVHCGLDGLDCRQLEEGDSMSLMPSAAPASTEASDEPRIAFLRIDRETAEGHDSGPGMPGGVYVKSLISGQLTRVSAGVDRVLALTPSWSADGKQIVFGAVEDLNANRTYDADEPGVYVSSIDTGEVRRVASGWLGSWKLSWSPAGDLVLVTGMEPGDPVPFVYALETSTGITYTHPEIGQITTACWSPEGDRIAAYSKEDHLVHILDSEGERIFALEAPYGDVLELIWTPRRADENSEGQLFAIAGTSFELGAGPLYQRSLSADTSERWTPVAGAQSFTALLSASTDGRYVAFTRFASQHEGDLYVLERGEPQPRQITSDPGFEGTATWVLVP